MGNVTDHRAKYRSIRQILEGSGARPDDTGWLTRHKTAMAVGSRIDGFWRRQVQGLIDYAEMHETACESPIGEDCFIGPAWLDMVKGLRTLLNGEHGQLDAGLIDETLVLLVMSVGFTQDDL